MREPNFGWDLPPGVSESMIPGNMSIDEQWTEAYNRTCDTCESYDQCGFVVHEIETKCPKFKAVFEGYNEPNNPDQEWDDRY